jgi:putative transposase
MKGVSVGIRDYKEVERLLKEEKDWSIKARFALLRLVAKGVSPESAAAEVGICRATAYKWIKAWNGKGYEGLLSHQGKGGGRPPQLSGNQLEELKGILASRDCWTTKEVRLLIKEMFGVEYSGNHVARTMRGKLGMHFAKPYPMDYRRPEEAEMILENELRRATEQIKSRGYEETDIVIGFCDEASPQTTANTARVWSFGKPHIKKHHEDES